MTNKQAIARFEYLANMIGKYAHRWNGNASHRLTSWVDEYNQLRSTHNEAFRAYCEKKQYSPSHDGYDCLA